MIRRTEDGQYVPTHEASPRDRTDQVFTVDLQSGTCYRILNRGGTRVRVQDPATIQALLEARRTETLQRAARRSHPRVQAPPELPDGDIYSIDPETGNCERVHPDGSRSPVEDPAIIQALRQAADPPTSADPRIGAAAAASLVVLLAGGSA